MTGVIDRLASGAGDEVEPSCASENEIAFTKIETRRDLWSVPFDLNKGTSLGTLQPITEDFARRDHAALSGNGRVVAFSSNQSGPVNVWLRNLDSGYESRIAASPAAQRYPVINSSGTRIAYSVFENGARALYLATPEGTTEKLCDVCLRATDWSKDDRTLLTFSGTPYEIDLLDVGSRQRTPLLKSPRYNLLYARFSPDNRWVSFTARVEPNRAIIAIAPLNGASPVTESSWIRIADEGPEDWANWSPDGNTLYYTSAQDGHSCLWGQRIDAGSRRPVGEAFAVQHFHGRLSYQQGGWSAAGGRIAAVLVDGTKNIWVMSHN